MTDHNLVEAARALRKRHEQHGLHAYPDGATERSDYLAFLAGVEDLADRVTLIESTQRAFLARLEFLGHISRVLGREDGSINESPKPGARATAAQARMPGASGTGELDPLGLAGTPSPTSEASPC